MLYRFDEKVCLNGWWDIRPEYEENHDESAVPGDGFEVGAYLVPSFYNRPWDAVKFPGETYYHPVDEKSGLVSDEKADVLYEAYGYPASWSAARAVWIRRTFTVLKRPRERYFIVAEAVGPRATLFINGQYVSVFRDYTLPFETDITDYVVDGENQLALLLSDYDYEDEKRRWTLWPSGGWTPYSMRGLWQDIYLVKKPDVYIDDITIVTSVRKKTIAVSYKVVNKSGAPFYGQIALSAAPYPTVDRELQGEIEDVCVAAGAQAEFRLEKAWAEPKLWDNYAPNLYMLTSVLSKDGQTADTVHERFGFREVWIDGIHVMLNGHPIHLFADWGHKTSPYQYTEGWIRKWFGMIRDYNLNHSRLHTNPHPPLILDIADEEGIMITCETAMHGSACEQGAGAEVYWERAYGHVARLIQRDKNHPSVLLWSCENEMRWNTPTQSSKELMRKHLPEIRALFKRLDPTRPAYHEGDTTCFNEKEQDILSRHYGRECTGMSWWDKKQPLHSGELGLYHLAGPNNTLQFGGDKVWERQDYINHYALEETAKVCLDARVNEVTALGPWNFSCLVNRREHGYMEFSYDDYTVPGMKPLKANANSSEFRFWEKEGKGYDQAPMTEDIPFIFRPFAAIDVSYRTSFYADKPIVKTITFVNDTAAGVIAVAEAYIRWEGGVHTVSGQVDVARGYTQTLTFDLSHPYPNGKCVLGVRVVADGRVIDSWERDIFLSSATKTLYMGRIAVLGDGSADKLLQLSGVMYDRVDCVPESGSFELLLIERGYVRPGMTINNDIKAFCSAGGRVILLEQHDSPFPGIEITEKSLLTSFKRMESPMLSGIDESELTYWGDSPYSLQSGDAYVADRLYMKDDGTRMLPVVDSGEGNFGDGDLERVALLEISEGRGAVIACQLNITARFEKVPAAVKLFVNMIDYAASYSAPGQSEPIDILADDPHLSDKLDKVYHGASAVAAELTPETAERIAAATGMELKLVLEPEGTYNCILTPSGRKVLAGLNNADLCGIEKFNYTVHAKNTVIADHVLEFADGLEPLAVTAPESCLRPFYVYGGSSEILRTYTATRYCAHAEEKKYVVAGRIPYAKGFLYISTFKKPEDGYKKLSRLYNTLYRNVFGVWRGDDPLDGACVKEKKGASRGYAEAVYCMNVSADDAAIAGMLDYCAYQNEHINPKPLLEKPGFARVRLEDGTLSASSFEKGKDVVIYFTVESRITRKRGNNDLGLPDPTAETFLDLTGEGTVDVWINTHHACSGVMHGDTVTASDISIENGFNHILLRWRPTDASSSLRMQWRDIMHMPETGFLF